MLNKERSAFGGKIKLTISLLLMLLTLAFIFKNSSESEAVLVSPTPLPNNNITSNFLLGSLHSAMDENFGEVNELGLNMWHRYTLGATSYQLGKNVPMGWIDSDSLTADNNTTYISDVTGILTGIKNNNGMRSLMQRPKIEYLCYGQRSDYQCEKYSIDPQLDFYSFNDHNTGTTVPDSGGYSVFCRVQNSTNNGPTWHNPGFVVKRLKCNTEQSKKLDDNQWQGDDQTTWHIKPRIRIDSTVADNPYNFNNPVCSLKIINGEAATMKNFIIRVRHFLDDFGNYDGRYLDEFRYEPGDDSLLIHNAWGDLWDWRSRGSRPNDDDRSKVDIQVYWYGLCDMWIDRVRVDNDVANKLFKGYYEEPGRNWLQWEAGIAAANPSPLKFYIETIEFNNLPCIAYVNKKLQSMGANIDMMTDLTHLYSTHVDWSDRATVMNAEHIKRFYIDSAGFKQILFESYPFTSAYFEEPDSAETYSRIPFTLNAAGRKVLAASVSPQVYDDWLQDNLDHSPYTLEPEVIADIPATDESVRCIFTPNFPEQDKGHFGFWMKLGRDVSRLSGKPFIYMQQAHQWFKPSEVRREPTNEEMELLTNLAVSYGAKGIIYYWFPSTADNSYRNTTFNV